MAIYRMVSSLPNSWFPPPGQRLLVDGINAENLVSRINGIRGGSAVCHSESEVYINEIEDSLGIEVKSSSSECPSPFETDDVIVVTSYLPGDIIGYSIVWDGTKILSDTGIY